MNTRRVDRAMSTMLSLDMVRTDGGTQSRACLDRNAIAEYAAELERGIGFPAIVVFYDGTTYWLADGFHRVEAFKAAGKNSIGAEVRQGTVRDAILHSVGANFGHGVRRTNADKRRAVELLLRDEEWSVRADRWIAEKCGVHHDTVATCRRELAESASSQVEERREGQDGKIRAVPKRKTNMEGVERARAAVVAEVAERDAKVIAVWKAEGGRSTGMTAKILGIPSNRVQEAIARSGLTKRQKESPLTRLISGAVDTEATWTMYLEEPEVWLSAGPEERAEAAEALRLAARKARKLANQIEKSEEEVNGATHDS